MIKVLQFAYGEAAPAAVRSLLRTCDVVGLIVPPEGKAPVLSVSETACIDRLHCPRPAGLSRLVETLRPDAVVICSYDRILPESVLGVIPVINVHYAPLPTYRGRATVNWAILNGLSQFSATIHLVTPGLDSGPILAHLPCDIAPDDTVQTLYNRLNTKLEENLGDIVVAYLEGRLKATPQNEASATYVCTRLPEDGLIDWHRSCEEIAAQVRALTRPFPGAFTYLHGERLIIWRASVPGDAPVYEGIVPGRIVSVHDDGYVDVLCADGVLRLLEVEHMITGATVPNELIRSTKETLDDGLRTRIQRLEDLVHALEMRMSTKRDFGG